MRERLTELLDGADQAIASCSGVVPAVEMQPLIDAVRRSRTRLDYPDDLVVVALAGGTGVGKSSLFNALAGEELADVGGVRPTTEEPAAAIPAGRATELGGYLDRIGVGRRHLIGEVTYCLVDLPDMDSVDAVNRLRVDGILPSADVIIWVTDPEKYRDSRLHHDYLAPLARHQYRMIFVLNQTDRLGDGEVPELIADFEIALAEDGIDSAKVLAVAADPRAGPPIGIEELKSELERMSADAGLVHEKVLAEVSTETRALMQAYPETVGFDVAAAATVDRATRSILDGDAAAATAELTAFLDGLATEAGGETKVRIGRLTGDVPQHVQRIGAEVTPPPPRRSWWRRAEPVDVADTGRVTSLLEESVVRPVRALLARREVAIASLAEIADEADRLSDMLHR